MKLLKLVPDHTNIDFMRWRNLALILSLIATAASIAFTAYRGLNLGVDFVGGQLVRVTFPQPVNVPPYGPHRDAEPLRQLRAGPVPVGLQEGQQSEESSRGLQHAFNLRAT